MAEPPTNLAGATPFQGPDVENLIKCNQKLKELGITSTIKLPQICVIGDQSAGKSSLIEALSMIKVPRAANCCTQCPLAINLSAGERPDSPWKCTISIELSFRYDRSMRNKNPTKSKPMGPWVPRPQTITHQFKTTYDKREICGLISAAQVAILNPDSDFRDFIPQESVTLPGEQLVQFSPNIVRLDISEGEWPNLSFMDLPGVIANTARKEDSFLIKLVENLVRCYAGDNNMVNILALPMTNDFANSMARRLIQDTGAESRTMAVLTKPDMANTEEMRKQFLDKFLEIEPPEYDYSYHMVMMKSKEMNHANSRAEEAAFFAKTEWKKAISDEKHRARLGVESLRERIRQVLFTKTRETLPENLHSIEERLTTVHEQLQQIRPPPDVKRLPITLVRLIGTFSAFTKKLFSGSGDAEGMSFLPQWKDCAEQFRENLRKASPTLQCQTEKELQRLNKAQSEIRKAIAATRKPGRDEEPFVVSSDDGSAEPPRPCMKQEANANTRVNRQWDISSLDEIRELNREYDHRGLPGQSQPNALLLMMATSVQNWDVPLTDFMNNTSRMVHAHVEILVEDIFGRFNKYDLSSVILKWVKHSLDQAIQEEWHKAESACDVEKSTPYTLDTERFTARARRSLANRTKERNELRLKLKQAEEDAKVAPKKAPKLGIDSLSADAYQTEIKMSSDAHAYYEIASARFADNVCQSIIARVFTKCSKNLGEGLEAHLGLEDESMQPQLQQWMAEDPERERQRQVLSREAERLVEGRAYIKNALGGAGHDNVNGYPPMADFSSPSHTRQRSITAGLTTPRGKRQHEELQDPPSTNAKLRRMECMTLNPRGGSAIDRHVEVEDEDDASD